LFLAGCSYEAPLDPNTQPLLGSISGEVVFGGATGTDPSAETELGPTYVLLYDAANPGPPAGTGTPITFAAVSPDAFSGTDVGIDAAPFTLTRVVPGQYLVNALVDMDGNFNPLVTALAGPTCGDWGGAHISDLVTQAQAPVTVSSGELTD